MKKIKNYNSFVKESVRDRMTPKSKEEVEREVEKLEPNRKLSVIFGFGIEDRYTKSELKDFLYSMDPDNMIYFLGNNNYKKRIDFLTDKEYKEILLSTDNVKLALEHIYQDYVDGVRTKMEIFTDKEVSDLLEKLDDGEKLDFILTYKIDCPKEKKEELIKKSAGETNIIVYDKVLGKTLKDIKVEYYDPKSKTHQEDKLIFTFDDGIVYEMYHSQDCSESVHIDDINGELDDLIGEPLTVAEEVSSRNTLASESGTWTFYKFATIKGYVTIRWYGSSNGYYSESVSFNQTRDEKGEYVYN
jgi:hypothetical protein